MQKEVKSYKLKVLPNNPIPNAILYVKSDTDTEVSMYITDFNGIPFPLKDEATGTGGIQTISNSDGTISVLGTNNTVLNLSTSIKNIINSALQPGANISELVNDENYITLADIPSQIVDLQATPSNTNVAIENTAGTDATILAATTTYAGVLLPTDKIKLDNTTGVNSGNQTSIVGIAGTKSQFNTEVTDGDFLFVGDVDKTSIGLSNVDNTSDLSKPISTATQTALDLKATDSNVIHKDSNPETKIGGFTSGGVNMSHPSDNWIALGTSVTFGGAYITPMGLQLGLIVTNLGVSGSTSANLASHYASIPALNSGNQDSYRLISIEHGINDAATSVPLATFRANIEAAIAHIKGKNWPNNKILIINGNYCSSAPLIPVQQAYADEAILIAKEQGVQYADIYNYTKNNGGSSLLADGVHPTTSGGEVYARGVIASMQGGGEFTNALSVVNGIVAGNIKSYSDSYVSGMTIGKGTGNIVNNTANGFEALLNITTGNRNTGVGYQVLKFNTTGASNSGTGYRALYSNTTGSNNSGWGWQAVMTNTTGSNNTGNGVNSLALNTTGSDNTASGFQSLISNTTGLKNTGTGVSSLYSNTSGVENTGIGYHSLLNLNSGSNNTATGTYAGKFFLDTSNGLTTSNNSLFIGHGSKALANGSNNEIVIGYNAVGSGSSTATLGNLSITKTQLRGTVYIPSLSIENTPTTSAGSYDFLSRNTSTGFVEKIPSANVQGTIVATTSTDYYRGDKTMQPLNGAVIGSVLTGFSAGAGTVASTDTVLQGFNKLAGNQALKADIFSAISTKTTDYTTLVTDETILVDATSGNITITLLNPVSNSGKKFTVKKIDSSVNTVTVSNSAGIDGTTTKVYSTQYSGSSFQSNGTQYYIISNF